MIKVLYKHGVKHCGECWDYHLDSNVPYNAMEEENCCKKNCCYKIYNGDKLICVTPKKHFTLLADIREQKINEIFKDETL